ncbi:MAG TPA: hypothetical protein VEI55_03045 [Candidatus Acidoferrum sp.]|nr:hypothetical protein [Candidatus Acidoferrum sp.]
MGIGTVMLFLLGVVIFLFLLGIVVSSFFTIEQAHSGVVQRLGKFLRIAPPGLNLKVPYIDRRGPHQPAGAAAGC